MQKDQIIEELATGRMSRRQLIEVDGVLNRFKRYGVSFTSGFQTKRK